MAKNKQDQDDDMIKPDLEAYPSGWNDDDVKTALALIGQNNTDKNARDAQNLRINALLKEASVTDEPTKPRYLGAKKAKQAVTKTVERIQPLRWTLQGDGASEEEEILITKAVKEALHRGNYDWSFTGKGGILDKIVRYGNAYRIIEPQDNTKTSFPVGFTVIDSNNLWFNVEATSFRNGNKNVTQMVALFTGTLREFNQKFPDYENKITPGKIPRAFSFKDLDQTSTQRFKTNYQQSGQDDDQQVMEWAYFWDSNDKCFISFAGADLQIMEKKEDKDYPYIFENIEGKKEAYIPVINYMCIPAEEGIYDVGVVAYVFDMSVLFRRTLNQVIGHVEENVYPHTLINIPEGQEDSFFNLVEMANQMRAGGQNAYIPMTFNPNSPGQISSANPILNGGDINAAQTLMQMIDDEFRKCGIYLDEPIDASVTATQIEYNASNALTLPKAIMKYNAPEIEFEVSVALDLLKKNIKKGDKTPLILDSTVDLPDGQYSIRGIPFSLGWLKEELTKRAWRVQSDPESGAVMNNAMLIGLYKSIMPSMNPQSPEYAAMNQKIALLSGVSTVKPNPASQMLAAQSAQGGGGQAPSQTPPPAAPPTPPLAQSAQIPTANQAAGLPA